MTSKTKEAGAPVDDVPAPKPVTLCAFRDTLYTSRVLVLLEAGRTLKVEKAQVTVASDDTVALEYLRGRKDFVPVEV